MLSEYRQAREHSQGLPVQTHHGNVGEAAVRSWLETFLPKRYGITAGYIRGQRLRTPFDYAHFDVIIYDQLESPVLWTESNPDKSSSGRSRVIPAEYVRAVFEVKATFHRRSVEEAFEKLSQLAPLMVGIDATDEKYPTYLPANVVLAVVLELHRDKATDFAAMEVLRRSADLPRVVYGPVILSGEGRSEDDTALATLTVSEQAFEQLALADGLLSHIYLSTSSPQNGRQLGTMLRWSPLHFSDFAFDLLALMNRTYRRGFLSSFHGMDLSQFGTDNPKGGAKSK